MGRVRESRNCGNEGKRFYIVTYGCQMNVRDSEVICGLLQEEGYKLIDEPARADIILFNTCSVRQHAEDKVWSEVGRIAKLRLSGYPVIRLSGKPIIGIIGCMAQEHKEKVFERAPNVDFVVGPSDIAKIPKVISRLLVIGSRLSQSGNKRTPDTGHRTPNTELFERKIWETDGEIRPEEIYHTGFYEDKDHAYVVISEGCLNFCSYCVVPYVRGPLRNRSHKGILKEIEESVDKGITKITLLGQNVCAYGAEYREQSTENRENSVSFIKLLELVNQINGLEEFSFVTSHPKDTSPELFKAMAGLKKLKKCLHLPVQSGSDRILKAMNRGYTKKFYLDLVDDYRKILKSGVLTTDIIVGFPGETLKDFQDTCDLVRQIKFDAAFIFKYSPRPNTEAEKLRDDVPREEKERRHALILELQKKISRKVKSKK